MNAIRNALRPRDESAVEAITMTLMVPFLIVLVLGLLNVGFYMRTRLLVDNVLTQSARAAAFDGGNYNPRLNTTGKSRSQIAYSLLYTTGRGCRLSPCRPGTPVVTCTPTLARIGENITCHVVYPYKAISQALFDQPVLGLGLGKIFRTINITVTARSETDGYTG